MVGDRGGAEEHPLEELPRLTREWLQPHRGPLGIGSDRQPIGYLGHPALEHRVFRKLLLDLNRQIVGVRVPALCRQALDVRNQGAGALHAPPRSIGEIENNREQNQHDHCGGDPRRSPKLPACSVRASLGRH